MDAGGIALAGENLKNSGKNCPNVHHKYNMH
jgi:hypothetical protein